MSLVSLNHELSPSESVIENIAASEGVDPTELDMPLFEAVDPDALDRLVKSAETRHNQTALQITFAYHGYDVRVTSDGSVHLTQTP